MDTLNGVLNLYKPAGMTSRRATSAVRSIFGVKKAGHCGTLDPDAKGILPVMLGSATRLEEYMSDDKKVYNASLRLGITTDTQDISGNVLTEFDGKLPDSDKIIEIAKSFVGEIYQVPPMYSALKRNGQKLYDLARQGITVEREPRKIHIFSLDVKKRDDGDYSLVICCSKGTYIRTLCADIGEKAGCGGCMSALERAAVGNFSLETAVSLDDLEKLSREEREKLLIPCEDCLNFEKITIPPAKEKLFCSGCEIYAYDFGKLQKPREGVIYRVYGENGFIAVGKAEIFGGKNEGDEPSVALKATKFF